MSHVILKSGGILEKAKWDSDLQADTYTDVTDMAICHLGDHVTFEDGLLLRDVFLLLNRELDLFEMVFGNWVKEYTELALNGEVQPESDNVDYLRLYWVVEIFEGELSFSPWPHLDGMGVASSDCEYGHYKAGQIVQFAVDFTPIQNNAQLPIKLSETVEFHNMDTKEFLTYKFDGYTLFHVLQGIIWELSFYGSPEDTLKVHEDILETVRRIDSGEEKLIPLEEAFPDSDD